MNQLAIHQCPSGEIMILTVILRNEDSTNTVFGNLNVQASNTLKRKRGRCEKL